LSSIAFLGLKNFGAVKYEEYLVDEEALAIFQEVNRIIREKALPVDIQPVKENYKREDTPGWKKDYYRLSFKLFNYWAGPISRLFILRISHDEIRKLPAFPAPAFWRPYSFLPGLSLSGYAILGPGFTSLFLPGRRRY